MVIYLKERKKGGGFGGKERNEDMMQLNPNPKKIKEVIKNNTVTFFKPDGHGSQLVIPVLGRLTGNPQRKLLVRLAEAKDSRQ